MNLFPFLASVRIGVAVLAFSAAQQASASYAPCPQFFAGGQAPDILVSSLTEKTHGVCYRFYSVAESGVSRTAIWSAEHLTRDSLVRAYQVPRVDAFHAEPSIAREDRAELRDFIGSGFDQGHMVPSGDAPDIRSQFETFSLGNMIPQSPDNNRNLWEGIEAATRGLAKYDGELYVVTGPAFVGPRGVVGGRVEVPTHVWKAIYDPRRGMAGAYITLNRPGLAYAEISIAELERIVGVDPFPAVPAYLKERAMRLFKPRLYGQTTDIEPVSEQSLGLGAPDQVSTIMGPQKALSGDVGVEQLEQKAAHSLIHGIISSILN